MSEKKFTVQPGDEIIIRVPSANKSAGRGSVPNVAPKKAMMPVRSLDDSGARRLKKGGFLNFYDFGQIFDEATQTFKDISFRANLFHSNDPFSATATSITASELHNLREFLFEVPVSEWKKKYRKLEFETAERYGVDLTVGETVETLAKYPAARIGSRSDVFGNPISDTKWTEKGLQPIEDNISNFQVFSFSGFMDFCVGELNGSRLFRVTDAPDYSAPDLTNFRLLKSADIFLVPTLFAHFSTHDEDAGEDSQIRKTLVNDYQILSREFWLNREIDEFPASAFSKFTSEPFALADENAADWTTRIKTQSGTQTIQLDTGSGIFSTSSGGGMFADNGYQSFAASYLTSNQIVNFTPSIVSPSVFVGAIQQGGKTFYIWSTFSYPLTTALSALLTGIPNEKGLFFAVS